MKKLFFILALLTFGLPVFSRHIAGGELFYEYLGQGSSASSSSFKFTLRLFRDCASTGPLLQDEQVTVGVYDNASQSLLQSVFLPIQGSVTTISLNTAHIACLIGSVSVCYEVALYSATIELPDNMAGYTLSRLGCCRIDGISNLTSPSRNVGSDYITQIPGMLTLNGKGNSSPQFNLKDTALVCARNKFSLDFGATDADGDSLIYSFCDGYTAPGSSNNIPPSPTLSLTPLPYGSGFSGTNPLGTNVKINPQTGVISGTAPVPGQYVVSVCISEIRNGIVISTHRKDFILKVQSCDLIAATIPTNIVNCKDYTVYFENESPSPAVQSYLWSFGDAANSTSTAPTVSFTYKDTGAYIARLQVVGPNGCKGEDSALIKIYPGFTPAFNITGSCFLNPYHLKDSTKAAYGVVNSWLWNFGDTNPATDTSSLQNPSHQYAAPATTTVTLIVGSSKGCLDTLQKVVHITDKPIIDLPFRDTLICSIDSLPLIVNSTGIIHWTPNKNIINPNTANPIVFPKDTTKYFVTVNNNGCINTDSVMVNVLNFIKVDIGKDTGICKTDTIQLNPVSYALSYKWTPASGLNNALVKYPLASPSKTTKYLVQANLGKCQASDSITIQVTPYPKAFAGYDSIICFGNKIQLHGSIVGSSFQWSPSNILLSANTLQPFAAPSKNSVFVLTVYDTIGCPKPSRDSVLIIVLPPIIVNAGRDTQIVENQPLQLNANVANAGDFMFSWSPSTGLSNTSIQSPIATISGIDSITYVVKVVSTAGCLGQDDIKVKIFKNGPEIYVPSAFTPNRDGLNDHFKPIPIGISVLKYFNIYNRWGQLIFSTSEIGKGWNGTLNGIKQSAGTYVYTTEGIDYTGKTIQRKGTFVLIE